MNERTQSASDGLAGVVAGRTAISTVEQAGAGLTYRGYTIDDLAGEASFEEVIYLLLYGDLPAQGELTDLRRRLSALTDLPASLKVILERLPSTAHPMDVLRTGCSALGCLEPEDGHPAHRIGERLLATLPTMLMYWHRRPQTELATTEDPEAFSLAGEFLRLLHDREPDETERRALDVALILYAEHEFNASTFAARVAASTLCDFYSAIVAALGALRGPLHGGANEAAMELIDRFDTPDDAEQGVRQALERRARIMGFGHRIYKERDPRSDIIREWSRRLAGRTGDERLHPIAERIESVMQQEKGLFPNLDFYSATVFRFLGIPTPLYTPIFALARLSGWSAHVIEQRQDNRLIRPSAEYVGPEPRSFLPLDQRRMTEPGEAGGGAAG
jgi:2-methylcitrate synthase